MATNSSHSYSILPEQSQEDALHSTRLLQVEERPFQRVTRNLLGKDSPLKWTPRQLPSPPPEGGEAEAASNEPSEEEVQNRQKFREEVLLDFAALENSILRIQLIQSSNARERERYAAEKAKILETAEAVKNNTVNLRAQLVEAQRMLELRKGYDELAAKLIDSEKLKKRAETKENINKLEKEIEDLEQESADFEGVWVGRREAFDKVVVEGQNLVKIIKGIKEEPGQELDKDEVMDDGGESIKGERSRMGSPAPEGTTPMPGELGDRTPLVESGMSPLRPTNKFLDVDDTLTREGSRVASPLIQPTEPKEQVDVEMSVEEQTEDAMRQNAEAGEAAEVEGMSEQVSTPAEVMDEG